MIIIDSRFCLLLKYKEFSKILFIKNVNKKIIVLLYIIKNIYILKKYLII